MKKELAQKIMMRINLIKNTQDEVMRKTLMIEVLSWIDGLCEGVLNNEDYSYIKEI